MGFVYAEFIFSLRQSRSARALIDTGSYYCVLPWAWMEELGVPNVGTERLRLADGSVVEAPVGPVWIAYGAPGRRVLASAAFLQTDEPAVGVEALEGLGLQVDPGGPPPGRPRLIDTGRTPAQRLLGLRIALRP